MRLVRFVRTHRWVSGPCSPSPVLRTAVFKLKLFRVIRDTPPPQSYLKGPSCGFGSHDSRSASETICSVDPSDLQQSL